MARVLVVGIDPEAVDFSDPALPPGLDVDTVRRGIASGLEALRSAGHDPHHVFIPTEPGEAARIVSGRLSGERFDCLAIGGGVRLPPRNLRLFEAVLNAAVRVSPAPAIALPTVPTQLPEAVGGVLA